MDNKKAFTIIEMVVAMGLLMMLVALSSLVFSTTVKAHRKAAATIEITRKLNAITSQLNQDFGALRKDGELFLVWVASPELDENNVVIDEDGNGIPDNYLKYDRIVFFADGDFQTMKQYDYDGDGDGNYNDGVKTVYGNLARISYMLARKMDGTTAQSITPRRRQILARVQHVITADAELPLFPDPAELPPGVWNPTKFEMDNFSHFEYQTMSMTDWTNMSDPTNPYFVAKNNILTILSGIQNILAVDGTVTEGGPKVEAGEPTTYQNYFSEGIGDFGIQIWRNDEQRWYPQIDPDHDGDYTDTDYPLDSAGTAIHETQVDGILYFGDGEANLRTAAGIPLQFTALKFTFTLYDSHGLFPDGKKFSHIVYINN